MSNFDERKKPKPYKERHANYMSRQGYTFIPKEMKTCVDELDLKALMYFLEKHGEDGKYFEQTLTMLGLIAEMEWKSKWEQEEWNKKQLELGNGDRAVVSTLSQDKQLLLKVIHACLYNYLITNKGEV